MELRPGVLRRTATQFSVSYVREKEREKERSSANRKREREKERWRESVREDGEFETTNVNEGGWTWITLRIEER